MTKLNMLAFASTVAVGVGFANPVEAATFLFNRAQWQEQMALAGTQLLVTDNFSNSIAGGISITFESGVVSTGFGGIEVNEVQGNFVDGGVLFSGTYAANMSTGGAAGSEGAIPTLFDSITWTFPFPVIGFGADFISTTSGEGLIVKGAFDGPDNPPVEFIFSDYFAGDGTGFLGVVGDLPFTQITFTTGGPSSGFANEFWLADNLSFGERADVQAVPEPASALALFAFGATACCFLKGKSKN